MSLAWFVVSQTGKRAGSSVKLGAMRVSRPREIIVTCLLWYPHCPLSYRDLQEMMAERGPKLDYSTTARGALPYAPVLDERIRLEIRWPSRSSRVDETSVRVAGTRTCSYPAIDSAGNTIDFLLLPKWDLTAAKTFLQNIVRKAQIRWLPKADLLARCSSSIARSAWQPALD